MLLGAWERGASMMRAACTLEVREVDVKLSGRASATAPRGRPWRRRAASEASRIVEGHPGDTTPGCASGGEHCSECYVNFRAGTVCKRGTVSAIRIRTGWYYTYRELRQGSTSSCQNGTSRVPRCSSMTAGEWGGGRCLVNGVAGADRVRRPWILDGSVIRVLGTFSYRSGGGRRSARARRKVLEDTRTPRDLTRHCERS